MLARSFFKPPSEMGVDRRSSQLADFYFNGELTMREKKKDDRSSAEMPEVWWYFSMIDEEASATSDG
jgi:hypothetical protein